MARIPRVMIAGEPTAYHLISRTALDGYPIEDAEKEFFVDVLRRFGRIYFVEILGFCCMGNHFHLLVRMRPDSDYSDAEIKRRLHLLYGDDQLFIDGQIPFYRQKWASLSEFMREVKLNFTRFYNRRNGRRGYFWGDRFKSVVVEDGNTLINCLAYIDLNPVRAGLVEKPEDYRWSSIGYHVQAGNKDKLLSLDLGLREFGHMDDKERFRRYRRFLYRAGAIDRGKGAVLDGTLLEMEQRREFRLPAGSRMLYRTRYFTDSGIIGTREYVRRTYRQVMDKFGAKRDKDKMGTDKMGTGQLCLTRSSPWSMCTPFPDFGGLIHGTNSESDDRGRAYRLPFDIADRPGRVPHRGRRERVFRRCAEALQQDLFC